MVRALVLAAVLAMAWPVHAVGDGLAELGREVGLPPLHWGMSKAQVARAAPGAVEGPACGIHPPTTATDLRIADWRFGAYAGVLCFGFSGGRLQTVSFDGLVPSRAEEDPVARRMQGIYGTYEDGDWPPRWGDRQMNWLFSDTIIFYSASEKPDGVHYGFEFVDRSKMCFMYDEDMGEMYSTGKFDPKKCLPLTRKK